MTRNLFWKILLGFWLTFIGIVEGIWLAFALTHPGLARDWGPSIGRAHVVAAATALHYGGPPALDQVIASWSPRDRDALAVRPIPAGAPLPAPRPHVWVQAATAQDGRTYSIAYDWSPPPDGPFGAPWEVPVLAVVGGLIFSAVLAWYLTRPIQTLARGFDRLAEGELSVRLGKQMGRRRDELADLARHFDTMAERLEQLVGARDRLLHDVSHELRSPLARLQTAIGLARQSPQKIASSLERIEREAQKLDALVGELLTLARAEAGAMRHDQYFDPVDLVRAVAEDARFEAEQLGVTVTLAAEEIAAPGPRPTVAGDAELLRRGLENVVRNALRYSRSGQRVTIAVRPPRAEPAYLIEIADQGPGVPEEALPSLFEPFVRVGESGREPGFGLGLSIARRAVQAHGGSISAANRDGGFTVSLLLPAS